MYSKMLKSIKNAVCTLIPLISLLNLHKSLPTVSAQVPEVCLPNPPPSPELSTPFATCDQSTIQNLANRHPDQNLNTPQILKKYGYPFKTYNITTADKYILTVYRVMGSPKSKPKAGKQVVYLNHGLGAASDNWNFQPGSRNLPFMLADAGYEVFIGNCRGTTYSLKHQSYDANININYWNFSFHEMGVFDVPAVINTILKETKQDKIFYIGHSMGTTEFFVAMSELPELNSKIQAAFLLAPIAYIGYMNSPLRLLLPALATDPMYQVVNTAVMGRIQSAQQVRQHFKISSGDLCDLTLAKCGLCDNFMFLLLGYDGPQMNNTELPNIVAKYPNNMSVKTLAHYCQLATSCKFAKYDNGPIGNMAAYKTAIAPEYNLGNITAPMYFFHGENDNLGQPNDVQITASKLRKGVLKSMYKVGDKLFNHGDFIMAKDADKLVYRKILSEMNKIS